MLWTSRLHVYRLPSGYLALQVHPCAFIVVMTHIMYANNLWKGTVIRTSYIYIMCTYRIRAACTRILYALITCVSTPTLQSRVYYHNLKHTFYIDFIRIATYLTMMLNLSYTAMHIGTYQKTKTNLTYITYNSSEIWHAKLLLHVCVTLYVSFVLQRFLSGACNT